MIDQNNDNNNNIKMFSINTLLNIYNLIELTCWDQFKDNLNDIYKLKINKDDKIIIKNYFDSNINENNSIKKQDIASAVRRLISRYLSGKRGDTDINEYKILFDYIQRPDLWRTELQEDENFETEIYMLFDGIKRETNIIIECNESDNKCDNCKQKGIICKECERCNCGLRIGHAFEFYELIKEEELGIINNEDNIDEKINNINENHNNGLNDNINVEEKI